MWHSALRIFEVLALRAVPGGLNLITLVFIGRWLGVDNFGLYSTYAATSSFLGNVLFGPIILGVISQFAGMSQDGREVEYVGNLTGVAAAGLVFLVLLSSGLWFWEPRTALMGLLAGVFGVYVLLQEIIRARLHIWLYGVTAAVQAMILFGLSFILIRPIGTVDIALIAFGLSYSTGMVTAYIFAGMPTPRLSGFAMMRDSFKIGASMTVSKVAESLLVLGTRYALVAVGATHALSIFSFCVDLAQRSTGFLLNAASFTFVPRAFKQLSIGEGNRAFFSTLTTGLWVSLALASLTTIVIIASHELGFWQSQGLFSPASFVVVSVAVVAARAIHLTISPILMRDGRAHELAALYALAALAAVVGTYILSTSDVPRPAEWAYLAGYGGLLGVCVVRYWKLGNKEMTSVSATRK